MHHGKAILVVDDEPMILEAVASYLRSRGYVVFAAAGGQEALAVFRREQIALVVLDLMLPDLPGEEVFRRLRQTSRTPVIMLTARAGEAEQLAGLHAGADDYVTKPFSLKILAARIEAVLRRTSADDTEDMINTVEKRLGRPLALTASERKILSLLMRHPGRIFTRDELIQSVMGEEFSGYDRVIDTHIKNIRRKLEDDPRNPVYVRTVHGLGYKYGGELP